MATLPWQPGTLYPPGSTVRAVSAPSPVADPVTNGDFESGDSGWTYATGFAINDGSGVSPNPHFQGTSSLTYAPAGSDSGRAINNNAAVVVPGQTINGTCRVRQGSASANRAGARCEIAWYDSGDVLISYSPGTDVNNGSNGEWKLSSVAAVAPATAAFARFVVYAFRQEGNGLRIDNCSWDAMTATAPSDLIFTAVQAVAGSSGAVEPVWPTVNGVQVTDNEVTWEATTTSVVTWEASPILVSGATEPSWVATPTAMVADNTIGWQAVSGRITDSRCPNTKAVAIAASKIFAVDDDIVAFSATVNPLDWSTPDDAGYLPFGLNSHGSTPATALGLYRSNLVAFNSEGYQMWQVDEDPANMSLLDASPIDCPFYRSVMPVSDDLVFLSARGIRSIGIAGASTNLQAGFFGAQIDPLVIEAIRGLVADESPMALFWPGAGQYWLFFGAEAFVLTMNGGTKDQSWSRYVFPAEISDWALVGTELYLRAGALVWRVTEEAIYDDQVSVTVTGGENRPFEGYIAWPYLDLGRIGQDKGLEGFDIVCDGTFRISFGYNQKHTSYATPEYALDGDTLPGDIIPMPLTAPSFQVRLSFDSGQEWEWQATNLYVNDTL